MEHQLALPPAGGRSANSAEQHVATTAAANYRERFLPDGYAFATDGKGLLASGGEYNARHRRLCQPAFARPREL